MRKYAFIGLFFLSVIHPTFSHSSVSEDSLTLDSLVHQLTQQLNDSTRVEILNELAWKLRATKNKQARKRAKEYAQKAISLSKRMGYKSGEATALNRLGLIFKEEEKYDQAIEAYENALAIETSIDNDRGMARAHFQIAVVYELKSQYQLALDHALESLVIFNQSDQPNPKKTDDLAMTYNLAGTLYMQTSNYEGALDCYLQSYEIRKAENDTLRMAWTALNLGTFYELRESYEKAENRVREALGIFQKFRNQKGEASAWNNLGNIYWARNELSQALDAYETSAQLKAELGQWNDLAGSYNNIALIQLLLGHLDEADTLFSKALAIWDTLGNPQGLSETYLNLGHLALKQQRLQAAEGYFSQSLAYATLGNHMFLRMEALEQLALTASTQKDYSQAYKYERRYNEIRDSIVEEHRKAMDLESKFLSEQKRVEVLEKEGERQEADLQRQQAEINTKNTTLLATLFGFVLILILFFVMLSRNREKNKALQAKELASEKEDELQHLLQDLEIKTLNAMLSGQDKERRRISSDLHDRLGSNLSMVQLYFQSFRELMDTVKGRARQTEEKFNKADHLLEESIQELRNISDNLASGVVTDSGLILALEELKARVNASGALTMEVLINKWSRLLSSELESQIYQMIQVCLSNTLKHSGAASVTIQLLQTSDNRIQITVEDDGKGFDQNVTNGLSKKRKGLGLKNIREKIEMLSGELVIDSFPGKGTIVTIAIPLLPTELGTKTITSS